MPINLFNNPLSSIKLGADNILKGYIGNAQIFPNDTEITAAAFTDANIANTGGNTPYVVSGEVGSSFTLTGSSGATAPSGTQVISASPSTYQIAIGNQSAVCGALARNPQVVIAPQGNTVLAGGLSNTDTIAQAAGPTITYNNIGLTISSSNTSYQTQTVGGQLRWLAGASWNISINYTVGAQNNVGYIFAGLAAAGGGGFVISSIVPSAGYQNANQIQFDPYNPPSRSFSANVTLQTGTAAYVSFNAQPTNVIACSYASPGSVSTGNIYP